MLGKRFLQFCLFIIFFITGTLIFPFHVLIYLSLHNTNKKLFRKINRYFCCLVNKQALVLSQWYTNSKLIIYTDKENFAKYFGKEHALCILNHRYNNDWIVMHMFAEALGIIGNTKVFAKAAVQHIPVLGFFLKMSENIFLKRTFKEDEEIIFNQISALTSSPHPLLIFLYPEGTRFNSLKHKASMEFAAQRNLKSLKYHLLPRTKGFTCCLKAMEGHLSAIYNLQLGLNKTDEEKGGVSAMLKAKSVTPHLYVERIPIEKVPATEDGQNEFLRELFIKKDKIMESFLTTESFFQTSGIERVDKFEFERMSSYFFIFLISVVICGPLFYYSARYLLSRDLMYLGIGTFIIAATIYVMINRILSALSNRGSSHGLN